MTDDSDKYADFADHIAGGAMGGFDGFSGWLHAGEMAPSFPLTRLDDGATVQFADLWRRTPTGAGSSPTGGISGLPGRNAAQRLLADWRRTRP